MNKIYVVMKRGSGTANEASPVAGFENEADALDCADAHRDSDTHTWVEELTYFKED